MLFRFLIIFIIVCIVEVYFLQAIKTISSSYSLVLKNSFLYACYFLAGAMILCSAISVFYPFPLWSTPFRFIFAILIVFFLCKLFGCTFLLVDDLIRFGKWIYSLFQTKDELTAGQGISRIQFLSKIAGIFALIPATALVYGMIGGAYRYKVHKVKIRSKKIPKEFNGFKIVQLSDIHCGSFLSEDPLKTAFEIVAKQQADLIVFTGDLVNNLASETENHLVAFASLKAPFGVYSIFGNHDYGDYSKWESEELKAENLDSLKKVHADSGWKLMLNENVKIQKDGAEIGLIGIENWGNKLRFPKYGDLLKANVGVNQENFNVLLSHDPSHWDSQVSQEADFKHIDLTLSGHTHGFQFGIEIPGFRWSPVQYVYKQWAGMYTRNAQMLYVNRGLGFLGYPGRVGIWPEITVFELISE